VTTAWHIPHRGSSFVPGRFLREPYNFATSATEENHMAAKKPNFPSRPCPKCGKPIHIKSKKHEECGWGMEASAETPSALIKRGGIPKKKPAKVAVANSNASVTMDDILAVKAVVSKLGAETVRQLAEVLEK
jgi:hypothetical protein